MLRNFESFVNAAREAISDGDSIDLCELGEDDTILDGPLDSLQIVELRTWLETLTLRELDDESSATIMTFGDAFLYVQQWQ